jgi:hypothetical protein
MHKQFACNQLPTRFYSTLNCTNLQVIINSSSSSTLGLLGVL